MKTAEDIIEDKYREIVSISWDQTVYQACRKMVVTKIGAILVKKGEEIVLAYTSWKKCFGIVFETHPHRKRWRVHRHAFNRRCA